MFAPCPWGTTGWAHLQASRCLQLNVRGLIDRFIAIEALWEGAMSADGFVQDPLGDGCVKEDCLGLCTRRRQLFRAASTTANWIQYSGQCDKNHADRIWG